MPTAQDIINAYRMYLGRTPSQDEINQWIGNADWQAGISGSPEAQAYAAAHPGGTVAPGNTGQGLRPGDSFTLPNGDAGYVNQDGTITDTQTGMPAGTIHDYPNYTGPIAPTGRNVPNQPNPNVVTPTGSNGNGTQTPPNGDWRKWFLSLVNGKPPTPDTLNGLADQLAPYGVKVIKNAEGVAGKIQLPDGSIIDVIQGAGAGGQAWQWLTPQDQAANAGSSGGNGQAQQLSPEEMEKILNSPLLQPWTKEFSYPEFQQPTDVTEQNDPGYQFRMQQGQQALERSAASKGTLLTGGTAKDLTDYEQNAASAEYGNVYNRAYNDWVTGYNKALQGYQQSYNVFENNQAKQFNRLAALSGLGQTAAGQLNSAGIQSAGGIAGTYGAYGSGLGGIYTGLGNALAGGALASGSATSNFFGGLANMGAVYGYTSAYGGA